MSVERLGPKPEWDELEQLYAQSVEVLAGLDRLRLFQAGAHLAMAIEAMRQRHPNLASFD
jgi:trehalose-6-phosphate synthase